LSSSNLAQNESTDQQAFTFEWSGGISYLTYLKVKTDVSLSERQVVVKKKNYILGAFPGGTKTTEMALANIARLTVGPKINWFDLMYSILFTVITLISMKLWFLILTAFFVWRTFNTCINIVDKYGNRVSIPTSSKDSANSFVQWVSQAANQYMEVAATAENAARPPFAQPIVPTVESSKMKTIFLFASAAVVALAFLIVLIMSRGGFDNKYVAWVKDGTVPGTTLSMSQVLENKKYFSNVKWKEVQEEGNDLDTFVMYQATLSDQGVKVAIRTIFQVFGEDHFEAVETSADGELVDTSEWYVFLADMADRYNSSANSNSNKVALDKKTKQAETRSAQATATPAKTSVPSTPSAKSSTVSGAINLKSFVKWAPSDPDITLPLKLDGEKVNLQVGLNTPNGVKLLALSEALKKGWNLQLDTVTDGESPFDDYGELKTDFSLYVKDYDFDNNAVPEVVIAASDGMLETYVWVFSYNYVFTERGVSPLTPIWFGEGQSDVILDGNAIQLPYGSQGLFDEYVFSKNTFVKRQP